MSLICQTQKPENSASGLLGEHDKLYMNQRRPKKLYLRRRPRMSISPGGDEGQHWRELMSPYTRFFVLILLTVTACSSSTGADNDEADVLIFFGEDAAADLDLGNADGTGDVADTVEVTEEVVECVQECGERQCGPDPVCGLSCGRCSDPDFPACNDGTCEATCDESLCAANTWCEEFECVPDCADDDCTADELCSELGIDVQNCLVFSCSDDGQTCESEETIETGGACDRVTEGDEVSDQTTGECSDIDACAVQGTQNLLATICQSGEPSDEPEVVGSQDCALTPNTELVLDTTYGDCTGFSEDCDVTGTKSRTRIYCDGVGGTNDTIDSVACERGVDTDTPVSTGGKECTWGNVCATSGEGVRAATCCDGAGGTESCDYAEACSRPILTSKEFSRDCSSCSYTPDSVCSEVQMQTCEVVYCDGAGGTQNAETETVRGTCTGSRDTDGDVVSSDTSACVDNDGSDPCNIDGTETTTTVTCVGGGRGESGGTAPCTAAYDPDPLGPIRPTGTCTATTGGCSYDGERPQEREYCDGDGGTEWRSYAVTTSCSLNGTVNDPDGDLCLYAPRLIGACDSEQCCRSGFTTNLYALEDVYTPGTYRLGTPTTTFTPSGTVVDSKNLVTVTEGTGTVREGIISAIRFDAVPAGATVTSATLCLTPATGHTTGATIGVFATGCNKWGEGVAGGPYFDCDLSLDSRRDLLATFTFPEASAAEQCLDFTTSLRTIAGTEANGIVLVSAKNVPIADAENAEVNGPRLEITYTLCN